MTEIDFVTGLTVCTYCDSVYVGNGSGCNFTTTGSNQIGLPMVFGGSGGPVGSIYYWDVGDCTPGIIGQTVTHVYTIPGHFMVCMSFGL